jgi:hypothetical protein
MGLNLQPYITGNGGSRQIDEKMLSGGYMK